MTSPFMEQLYPPIKMIKPGREYYQQIVNTQLIMVLYILIFFSNLTGEGGSIVEQVEHASFSGPMVAALITQILIMVVDRFIHKSRSFVYENQAEMQTQN